MPTVNSTLGKVPLDGEICFNSLEHKHLYNCPWFIASLRLSSSSNHDPFGYTQVSAHADSRAWPQARSGRRVPGDFSHAMLWAWPLSGSRGDTPHFFRVLHIRFCFPHVSEAHLANWDIILGPWVQKKKKAKIGKSSSLEVRVYDPPARPEVMELWHSLWSDEIKQMAKKCPLNKWRWEEPTVNSGRCALSTMPKLSMQNLHAEIPGVLNPNSPWLQQVLEWWAGSVSEERLGWCKTALKHTVRITLKMIGWL